MKRSKLLSVSHISKRFGGSLVIDDVNFEIESGDRVALIGPNGAGKTTAFNLITGVYSPDGGTVALDGADMKTVAPRRRIGMGMARTFQNIRLVAELSVIENVMLPQAARSSQLASLFHLVRGGETNHWRKQARQALSDANLLQYAEAFPPTLPYGVQKQVELVRALVSKPKLLLLDEPAAGLNAVETDAMLQRLRRISDEGISLLVVEHDMGFVSALCSRVLVLNFGKLIANGSPADIRRNSQVREAYLGTENQLGGA